MFKEGTLSLAAADLARAIGIPEPEVAGRVAEACGRADVALAAARKAGMEVTPGGAPGYPNLLAHIVDPPIALWSRGILASAAAPAIAIVGSRRPSPVGLATAARLAGGLAKAGLVVVSGLARGIDAAAHQAALKAGGRSVAVLGSGLDRVYPSEHQSLAEALAVSGCLLSELPPGTPPRPRHFPLRNRIISGLSLAVVVVEAAEKSGSLITARTALEQGRGVAAVPGNVVSGCHQGCHALIKDGARLVETVEDVLEEIAWSPSAVGLPTTSDKRLSPNGLLAFMKVGEPLGIDQIAALAGLAGPTVLAQISRLELDGQVERTAPGLYVRLD